MRSKTLSIKLFPLSFLTMCVTGLLALVIVAIFDGCYRNIDHKADFFRVA